MKKFLLLVYLLSIAAFYGYSQSLTISTTGGTDVTNGSFTQVGTPDSLELLTYLYVKNVSTHNVNVYCKKIEVSLLDSTEVYLCWAGGCYNSATYCSPNAAAFTPGQTITDFSGHYSTTAAHGFKKGESIIRWVFFCEANHNDSAYVTVKYTSYPLGIDNSNGESVLSAVYPNPAGEFTTVSYSVPAGLQGTVVIRNLVGATVYSGQVSAGKAKVTVNTSALSDGIYFCSLLVDGKATQTRKLVVRH